jgi:transposase
MLIIGCDYHPGFQQIAFVDTETGECGERRLAHPGEAEQFYRELKQQNLAVRVGMESSGHSRWFERLLRDLQFELWIGDAAEIRTKRVRKQKTDRQDAQLLRRLRLLVGLRFSIAFSDAGQTLHQPYYRRDERSGDPSFPQTGPRSRSRLNFQNDFFGNLP